MPLSVGGPLEGRNVNAEAGGWFDARVDTREQRPAPESVGYAALVEGDATLEESLELIAQLRARRP